MSFTVSVKHEDCILWLCLCFPSCWFVKQTASSGADTVGCDRDCDSVVSPNKQTKLFGWRSCVSGQRGEGRPGVHRTSCPSTHTELGKPIGSTRTYVAWFQWGRVKGGLGQQLACGDPVCPLSIAQWHPGNEEHLCRRRDSKRGIGRPAGVMWQLKRSWSCPANTTNEGNHLKGHRTALARKAVGSIIK